MKKYFSRFARICLLITAISVCLYAASLRSSAVADLLNTTVSSLVRFVLSSLTYLLPFSLFEVLIILSPVLLVVIVVIATRRVDRKADMIRGVVTFLSVIAIIFTAYIYTLGIGYRTTRLAQRIDVDDSPDISTEELCYALSVVVDGLRRECDNVHFEAGETHMRYSYDEMSKKLIHAYDLMNEEYSLVQNFTSRIKPVHFSTVMSDLGISGIYSFFTGESNVNVEYPDYYLPFTAAHELAHQRGISREDEANFVAFLVCIASEDAYIRYSGYLNMYEYLVYALYTVDPELYRESMRSIPDVAVYDIIASNKVYQEHKDSPLGKINERINDAYLKANGTEGITSYGYVVRLTVGYYNKQNNG